MDRKTIFKKLGKLFLILSVFFSIALFVFPESALFTAKYIFKISIVFSFVCTVLWVLKIKRNEYVLHNIFMPIPISALLLLMTKIVMPLANYKFTNDLPKNIEALQDPNPYVRNKAMDRIVLANPDVSVIPAMIR